MTNAQAIGIGSLYIVATPIGNLQDISMRALNILKSVDLILAEDTRHSMHLLNALGIKNNLSSFHAHNEHEKSTQIIEKLLSGLSVALISDAGTPLISDPGFPLVKQARQHHIPVVPVPGACALITALSASGVACDSFLFLGFLPAKQSARVKKLSALRAQPYTLVFYESTHRIIACIDDVAEVFGINCEVVLAKELTKNYEHIISASVSEIKDWLLADAGHIKGEFVIIIPPQDSATDKALDDEVLTVLMQELPLKQAVAIASKLTKKNKNDLYEAALLLKNNP